MSCYASLRILAIVFLCAGCLASAAVQGRVALRTDAVRPVAAADDPSPPAAPRKNPLLAWWAVAHCAGLS